MDGIGIGAGGFSRIAEYLCRRLGRGYGWCSLRGRHRAGKKEASDWTPPFFQQAWVELVALALALSSIFSDSALGFWSRAMVAGRLVLGPRHLPFCRGRQGW